MDIMDRKKLGSLPGLAGKMRDAALEGFWREWYPRLKVYYRSFPWLTEEDREEVAADAVERAFNALETYDWRKPFEPWMYAVARRKALDGARTARGKHEAHVDPAMFDTVVDERRIGPEAETVRREEGDFLRAFVASLPEREREVAFLGFAEDLKVAEITEVTGEPVGTVKWRFSEVRRKLRAEWGREYGNA